MLIKSDSFQIILINAPPNSVFCLKLTLAFVLSSKVLEIKIPSPSPLLFLEIIFKDSKGFNYNFYNLPHSLSFLVEKIN